MSPSGKLLKQRLIERDGNYCHYCGIELEDNSNRSFNHNGISVDHVIPVARGGSSRLDNLVLCCRRCNRKKLTTEYGEFCFALWTDGMLLRLMELEDQSLIHPEVD